MTFGMSSGAAPAPSRTIAVIEDERSIASAVAARLRSEGYAVEIAADGPAGVALCDRIRPDLVILDLMLPGLDGLEVCERIQAERPVPVLMLTARDSEHDLLVGLAVGADDYMTKPFSSRELVARVHALLRRVDRHGPADGDDVCTIRDIEIDGPARIVRRGNEPVHLTPTEFSLLEFLMRNAGQVLTRKMLSEHLWDSNWEGVTNVIEVHITRLRGKIDRDFDQPLLQTVRGRGYVLRAS